MEIKLLKITHSFLNKNVYYVDVEIVDRKIRIKGMTYRSKFDRLFFPRILTEGKALYCPVMFTDPEEIQEFILKSLEAIHANPLPEAQEPIDNDEKIILKRIAKKQKIAIEKKERNSLQIEKENENKISHPIIKPIIPRDPNKLQFGKKTFTEVSLRK